MHVSPEAEGILVEKVLEWSALQRVPISLGWRIQKILEEGFVVEFALIHSWLQRCDEIEEEGVVFWCRQVYDVVLDGCVDRHDWLM